jgi:hypothetical protein
MSTPSFSPFSSSRPVAGPGDGPRLLLLLLLLAALAATAAATTARQCSSRGPTVTRSVGHDWRRNPTAEAAPYCTRSASCSRRSASSLCRRRSAPSFCCPPSSSSSSNPPNDPLRRRRRPHR